MNKRVENGSINEKRLLDVKELCQYTGLGETSARRWANEIRAARKFGKRVLFDKIVIDAALDAINDMGE